MAKMTIVNIKGDYDTIEVTFEDGRKVEIGGDLVYNGFIAYENSIKKWKVPEGKPISKKEKDEIIRTVIERTKDSSVKITFETYKPPTESDVEEGMNAFLARLKNAGFDVKEVE